MYSPRRLIRAPGRGATPIYMCGLSSPVSNNQTYDVTTIEINLYELSAPARKVQIFDPPVGPLPARRPPDLLPGLPDKQGSVWHLGKHGHRAGLRGSDPRSGRL